jgi:hypothetical protein
VSFFYNRATKGVQKIIPKIRCEVFCDGVNDHILTSCSPVGTRYQTTQRRMPRDGSCTNPTGCCVSTCGPLPLSVPQRTTNSTHSFRTLCPRRKILLWRMTSCRRVSCRLVYKRFGGTRCLHLQCWTIESLLGFWHVCGFCVPMVGRLSDSCPALYSEPLSTRPSESGPLPFLQLETRRSGHPVFGEKLFTGLCILYAVYR